MGLEQAQNEVYETATACKDGERFIVVTRIENGEWLASQWEADYVTTNLAKYLYPHLLRMGAGPNESTALRRMNRRRLTPRVA